MQIFVMEGSIAQWDEFYCIPKMSPLFQNLSRMRW